MSMGLQKFVTEYLNAHVVVMGTEDYKPGMLLEVDWNERFWILKDGTPELERADGLAWDLLQIPATGFEDKMVDANVIQSSINEKGTLKGNLNLPGFGLSLDLDNQTEFRALFKVKGIQARVFEDASAPFHLMQKLLAIKGANPDLWDWVNNDLLITSAFHVTMMEATFEDSGSTSAKAAFNAGKIKVGTGVDVSWQSDSKFTMVGSNATPIAVRGLKI